MSNCAQCNVPGSKSACGRCKLVEYCGRDCQKKHWVKHKQVCGKSAEELEKIAENKRELRIYQAAESILGNILVLAAHGQCEVVVTINSTIDSFLANRLQFAALSRGESRVGVTDRVSARFVLTDYTKCIELPINKPLAQVQKNNDDPGASSQVLFEIACG